MRSFLYSILAMAWMLACAPVFAEERGFIGYQAQYVGTTSEYVITGENTQVGVTIENTGLSTYFEMQVLSAPTDWIVVNKTPGTYFVNQEDQFNFILTILAGSAGPGNISVRFILYSDLTDRVPFAEEVLTFIGVPRPGAFSITDPTYGQQLEGRHVVIWEPSFAATAYDMVITRQQTGQTVMSFFNITGVSQSIETDTLEREQNYFITVTAKNEVASTQNLGGPVLFQTKPHTPLGSFTINSPAPNSEVGTRPTFFWSASANATSYDFVLLPEVNGQPGLTPFRQVIGLTTTSYVWQDPELPVGNYYGRVIARGPAGMLSNANGPIRIRVSNLGHFQLLSPSGGEELVPRDIRFTWEWAENAEYYAFHIYQELGDRSPLYYSDTVPVVPGLFDYYLPLQYALAPGQRYSWEVQAFNGQESRYNSNGRISFTATPLTYFDLLEPAPDAPAVAQVPTFTWRMPAGGVAYQLELVDVLEDGSLDLQNIRRSTDSITQPQWTSTFPPFEKGSKHAWRVAATDSRNVVHNLGHWRRFTVDPLTDFSLDFPTENLLEVSTVPTLIWDPVPLATGYRINLSIPGEFSLPPIELGPGQASFNFASRGLHLNGDTFYQWSVDALAEGTSRRSLERWTFKTTTRSEVNACDIIDHVIGRQKLSELERAAAGEFGLLDCGTYYRYLQFPDAVECPTPTN